MLTPGTMRLTLRHDNLVSNFALNSNLRRYTADTLEYKYVLIIDWCDPVHDRYDPDRDSYCEPCCW